MIDKKQLKFYLQGKVDVNTGQIIKGLSLLPDDLELLDGYLNELMNEGWITKRFCKEHNVFEYHPGNKQFDEGVACCRPPEPSL